MLTFIIINLTLILILTKVMTLTLSLTSFLVVDVYQEWSGPVKPLIASLRRLKNELGDNLLKFLVVSETHTVATLKLSLEQYIVFARIYLILGIHVV